MATCAFALVVVAGLTGGGQTVAPSLQVRASYVAKPEQALLFEVRAAQDHAVYEADLPWGNFYSVQLTFRTASGQIVCPLLVQPLDDPSDTEVQLKAGDSRSGRVKLLPRCPSLSRLTADGQVTVEWKYTGVVNRLGQNAPTGRVAIRHAR